MKYHEFPCDPQRREAWLKNISREGPSGKGSKWEPSDRSLVCALHFTEDDYRKDTKLRLLLPTAVPTVFPGYPKYMQKKRLVPRPLRKKQVVTGPGNAQPRKRRRRNLADDAVVGSSDCKSSRESTKIESSSRFYKYEIEELVPESATEPCGEHSFADRACQTTLFADKDCQTTLLADQACQTTILADQACQTLAHVSEEAKKTLNRLKERLARQGEQLEKLRADRDRMKERLSFYENNKDIQAFVQVLQNAQKGDKALLQ